MTSKATGKRIQRKASLADVPLALMRINPLAQRDLNTGRVDKLVAEMDLEQLGTPTCSHRDDLFFLLDGHHRIEALKKWLGDDWETQSYPCWTYVGLSEQDEAEVFLKLNDTLTVTAFDRFTKGVAAGRSEESEIDRIVREQGLRISRQVGSGSVRAVGTLRRVYRLGPNVLDLALGMVQAAYGETGLDAHVIEGVGLLVQRYDGELDHEVAVNRLRKTTGGLHGLLNAAEGLRLKTGNPRAHCIAAAAVDIYNRGRGGRKLPSWWRAEN